MKAFLLLGLWGLTGCSWVNPKANLLEGWVGQSSETLLTVWGAPESQTAVEEGALWQYSFHETQYETGYAWNDLTHRHPQTTEKTKVCRVLFHVTAFHVTTASRQGDLSVCRQAIDEGKRAPHAPH